MIDFFSDKTACQSLAFSQLTDCEDVPVPVQYGEGEREEQTEQAGQNY
jgi:hypothetical protein